ncbi:MAG: Mut7-C RNAse domain-containing protein [bacterium]
MRPKFVVDADLHPLCKALRILGCDALYCGNLNLRQTLQSAIEERRIWIRSRMDDLNLQFGVRYFVIQSNTVPEQLQELDSQYSLRALINPFSRCLKCNEELIPASKVEVEAGVPLKARETYNQFYICPCCRRFYWQGGHWQRMSEKLKTWGWSA